MAPTYAAEVRASYRSPEYQDNPPAICAECRQLIAANEDREVTAHPGEFVHLSCFQVRAQREDEGFFLLSVEQLAGEVRELLQENPVTGKESKAGAERRALVAEASRLLSAAAKVGVVAGQRKAVA